MVNVSLERSSRAVIADGRLNTESKVPTPRPLHSSRTYVTSTATYIFPIETPVKLQEIEEAAMKTCRRRDDSPRTPTPSMLFRSEQIGSEAFNLGRSTRRRQPSGTKASRYGLTLAWLTRVWIWRASVCFQGCFRAGRSGQVAASVGMTSPMNARCDCGLTEVVSENRGGACAVPFQGLRSSAGMRVAAVAHPTPQITLANLHNSTISSVRLPEHSWIKPNYDLRFFV